MLEIIKELFSYFLSVAGTILGFIAKLWFVFVSNMFQIMAAALISAMLFEGFGFREKVINNYFYDKKYGTFYGFLVLIGGVVFVYYLLSETNLLLGLYGFFTNFTVLDSWEMMFGD